MRYDTSGRRRSAPVSQEPRDHRTFEGPFAEREQPGIPFAFEDYLALVDYTGRAIDPKKKGAIANTLPPILERLGLTPDQWLAQSTQFEALYRQQRQRSVA